MNDPRLDAPLDPALEARLAGLSPAKRALFLRGGGFSSEDARRRLELGNQGGFPRRNSPLPAPMSFAQELLWRLERVSPGYVYNVPRVARLRGVLDHAALQQALNALIVRHEILRTTFDLHNEIPSQIVHPPRDVPLELVSLESVSPTLEVDVRRLVSERMRRPFDLARDLQLRATLVCLSPDDHVLLLESHHVASDAVSRGILRRELEALYQERVGGPPASLPPLPVQYADFAVWQRDRLRGDYLERELDYWREAMRGAVACELPTDHPRAATLLSEGSSETITLPIELLHRLRALSGASNVTLFMTLLAGFQLLLAKYSGQTDIITGSPISGRPHSDLEGVVGYFTNTLLLRTSLEGNPPFLELLQRVRRVCLAGFEHQEVPFELLANELRGTSEADPGSLLRVVFSMQEGDAGRGLTLTGTEPVPFMASREAAKFDLMLSASERPSGLRLSLEYRRTLFEPETVRRKLRHLATLLSSVVSAPERPIGSLTMLSIGETRQVVEDFNQTTASYPRNATVPRLFNEVARRQPDAIAVIQQEQSMSYQELDGRSARLANRLASLGVGDGALVGLCAERSVDAIVAMLAILKAGGAYVPLDPSYPVERLGFMLKDTRMRWCLTQLHLGGLLEAAGRSAGVPCPTIVAIDQSGPDPIVTRSVGSREPNTGKLPAYVMYTSGSTGRPKGVVASHRAIVRLVRGTNYVRLDDQCVLLGFAPLSFDASTFEIWGALLNGGRLVLAPPRLADLAELGALIERARVTTLWLTSGLFRQIVDGGLESYRTVTQLLTGGDVLPVAQVRGALASLSGRVINGYGPTENTTFTACYEIPADWPADQAIPIGRPIANTRVYLLDQWGAPVPVGVPGELFAAGDGVALGYLDRPELTRERFLPDRFGQDPDAIMYRTGDRARWRPDGTLDFLGRMDQQVKIRGFRVEPGEIEAVLRLHPSVRDAVVVPDRSVGDTRLTGYYVPSQVPASGTAPTQAALRSWLAERLPDYYVPTFLIPVESFPLGSTGKVNPSALPAHGAESRTERYQAPRSTIEHELLQIWERLLRPSGRLGVFDDFFERGGHSLLAIQMITEVQRIRGQRIPLSWLFESSTIATLAARLSTAQVSEEAALVVLQREQPGAPIAFIHGDWTGGGWYVRRLAPLIAPEAPVFVLPTVGEGDASTPWSIERIAARHVAELRTVQPRGPYRLIGYCISGVIAYEMACQLVAAGEQVDKLIVVDGAPMNARLTGWRPLIGAIPDWFERRLALQRAVLGRLRWIDLQLRRLRKRSIPGSTAWALRAIGRRTPLRGLFRLAAPDPGPVPDSREGLDQDAIVGRVQQQAAEAYLPRPYSGILDFLWAAGAPGGYTRSNPIERWRPLAREVRLHSIESGHIGLITENLHLFAEALREVLERRP